MQHQVLMSDPNELKASSSSNSNKGENFQKEMRRVILDLTIASNRDVHLTPELLASLLKRINRIKDKFFEYHNNQSFLRTLDKEEIKPVALFCFAAGVFFIRRVKDVQIQFYQAFPQISGSHPHNPHYATTAFTGHFAEMAYCLEWCQTGLEFFLQKPKDTPEGFRCLYRDYLLDESGLTPERLEFVRQVIARFRVDIQYPIYQHRLSRVLHNEKPTVIPDVGSSQVSMTKEEKAKTAKENKQAQDSTQIIRKTLQRRISEIFDDSRDYETPQVRQRETKINIKETVKQFHQNSDGSDETLLLMHEAFGQRYKKTDSLPSEEVLQGEHDEEIEKEGAFLDAQHKKVEKLIDTTTQEMKDKKEELKGLLPRLQQKEKEIAQLLSDKREEELKFSPENQQLAMSIRQELQKEATSFGSAKSFSGKKMGKRKRKRTGKSNLVQSVPLSLIEKEIDAACVVLQEAEQNSENPDKLIILIKIIRELHERLKCEIQNKVTLLAGIDTDRFAEQARRVFPQKLFDLKNRKREREPVDEKSERADQPKAKKLKTEDPKTTQKPKAESNGFFSELASVQDNQRSACSRFLRNAVPNRGTFGSMTPRR